MSERFNDEYCESCGEIAGHCPVCCSNDFPGSEQCELCEYYEECKGGHP